MSEPRRDAGALLRRVRIAALLIGSGALLYAMVLAPDEPGRRDLAWTVGIAALVLSLVANWLLRRQPDDS